MREKSVAIVLVVTIGAALLAAGAVTAAAEETTDLGVDVAQADDGNATVTVTQNDTGVANSSVAVETVDNESYDGVGEYLTDENGTVGLPAPANDTNVSVNATVGNETVSTTATLTAVDEDDSESPKNFGQMLSAFIDALLNDSENGDTVGEAISNFVLDNNPAADKIPDHAGPSGEDTERGPPAHAGPENDTDRGPSEDAGVDDNAEEEPDDEGDDERGPPAHAGPDGDDEDGDDGEESENREDEQEDDEDEQESEDEEDSQGPPGHAGPP